MLSSQFSNYLVLITELLRNETLFEAIMTDISSMNYEDAKWQVGHSTASDSAWTPQSWILWHQLHPVQISSSLPHCLVLQQESGLVIQFIAMLLLLIDVGVDFC